jgi:secondary thiamine-phosphate synthase enzyme
MKVQRAGGERRLGKCDRMESSLLLIIDCQLRPTGPRPDMVGGLNSPLIFDSDFQLGRASRCRRRDRGLVYWLSPLSVPRLKLLLTIAPRMTNIQAMHQLTIDSKAHTVFIPITRELQKIVKTNGWKDGVLTVYVPHTTAGLTIQENADPDVVRDMIHALDKIVPWNDPNYRHGEGNTAAHVKSAMMGSSAQCLVSDGEIQLGTWQGVFFCEFDGPRTRNVWITFSPA